MFTMMATAKAGFPLKSLLFASLTLFVLLHDVAGFDCDIVPKEKNFLDSINPISAKSCPRVIDDSDKMFCCTTEEYGGISLNYCCDAQAFIQMRWVIYTLVGISVGILAGCCLCGCCCYRRRRGAVYGRVQTVVMQPPVAVQIPQGPYPVQQYAMHGQQQAPPPYSAAPMHVYAQQGIPPGSPATTQVYVQQGAAATQEYAKQAPYNPHAY